MNTGIVSLLFIFIATLISRRSEVRAVSETHKRKILCNYINFITIVFILIAGLRNVAVGPDTYNYYMHFTDYSSMDIKSLYDDILVYLKYNEGKDPGFPVLCKLFSLVFDSFRIFVISVSALFFSAFAYALKKYTHTINQALVAFLIFDGIFLIYAFSSIRQDIALSLTVLSIGFVQKRKLWKFLIMIALAALIHKSALLFLPYYWIAPIKNVKTLSAIMVVLLPILFSMARPIAILLASASGSEHYMNYALSTWKTGAYTYTVCLICCFIFYMLSLGNLNRLYPQHHYWTNTIFLTMAFSPLSWIDPSLMRVQLYYSMFLPIIMGVCIDSIRNRDTVKYVRRTIVAILVLLVMKTSIEYDFFWNSMPLGLNYGFNATTAGI